MLKSKHMLILKNVFQSFFEKQMLANLLLETGFYIKLNYLLVCHSLSATLSSPSFISFPSYIRSQDIIILNHGTSPFLPYSKSQIIHLPQHWRHSQYYLYCLILSYIMVKWIIAKLSLTTSILFILFFIYCPFLFLLNS